MMKYQYDSVTEMQDKPTLEKLDATAKKHTVEIDENANVNSIVFVTLAEGEQIDDVTITENVDLFAAWAVGVNYAVGALRTYGGVVYRCAQAHTAQADWTPDITPAMWVLVGDPSDPYPAWAQPIGALDAYALGATCSHNDENWVSTVDANVWEPGVYGWEVVAV